MTELEFKSLSQQGYNRIPLIAEAFADLETPLTLYLKLAQTQQGGKNTFLLESVVGGDQQPAQCAGQPADEVDGSVQGLTRF